MKCNSRCWNAKSRICTCSCNGRNHGIITKEGVIVNRRANYEIVEDTPEVLCLEDMGPWDKFLTVTNDADHVVEELLPVLGNRRLEYYDSDGQRDQLLVKDGKFAGFAPAG